MLILLLRDVVQIRMSLGISPDAGTFSVQVLINNRAETDLDGMMA